SLLSTVSVTDWPSLLPVRSGLTVTCHVVGFIVPGGMRYAALATISGGVSLLKMFGLNVTETTVRSSRLSSTPSYLTTICTSSTEPLPRFGVKDTVSVLPGATVTDDRLSLPLPPLRGSTDTSKVALSVPVLEMRTGIDCVTCIDEPKNSGKSIALLLSAAL